MDGCPEHMECIYNYALPVWKDLDKFPSFEISILLLSLCVVFLINIYFYFHFLCSDGSNKATDSG